MRKSIRVMYAIVFMLLLEGANYYVRGSFDIPTDNHLIWFQAGFLSLIIGSFLTEHFQTKPTDAIASSASLFFTTFTLQEPPFIWAWTVLKLLCAFVFLLCIVLMSIEKSTYEITPRIRTIGRAAYILVKELGSAKILCTYAFVFGVLSFVEQDKQAWLLVIWIILALSVLSKPHQIIKNLFSLWRTNIPAPEYCGIVTGFEDANIVVVQLNNELSTLSVIAACPDPIFDESNALYLLVLHTFQGNNMLMARTIILDHQESRWNAQKYIFKVEHCQEQVNHSYIYSRRSDIIGLVGNNSEIGKLNIQLYVDDRIIKNNDIVQVRYREGNILYQIVNAIVNEEKINRDSLGYTMAIAIQVGTWNTERMCFEDFNWVPPINTIVFRAEPFTEIATCTRAYTTNQMVLGTFNTGHPILVNKSELVTHNTAILGVTGSGKSCLGYTIIEGLIARGIKVICIDNSGDYNNHVRPITGNSRIINGVNAIDAFLASTDVFVVATATNVHSALEITRRTYEWAQQQYNPAQIAIEPKVCIFMEEAHSLIPEWNSAVNPGDRDLVNQISKYIMQGRKFGCGVIIVTQRTANVTKSVLSQCNTIISFQAFDKTSNDFLSSFMEEDYVENICRLNNGHAIIAGKALISGRPVAIQSIRRA
ncbi:ATP-binding protein [Acetonema longum]|uniref:Helicase HerA central domain-containing protein n=1 Tax=Acetonema longum DSM 6540 TaxID=1009370 RepID=F7NLV2_9FIRM|nr:DUF87 domain-containing protein [Acetonema longum]EGO62980.1 hypothetical protein ALO_15382 [Acetonema longum DSM 6540]